jgi:hypothetical protein
MSTVARRFLASPVRLSSAAWEAISRVICQGDERAAAEFAKISGIASSLINDQIFKDNPLILKNEGPRLRVYCIYGEDAVSGDDKNEDSLSWKPTAKDWHAFLPCSDEEYSEMKGLLKVKSAKFTLYNIEDGVPEAEDTKTSPGAQEAVTVNWGALQKL